MKFNYFLPRKFKEFVQTCFRIFDSGEPGIFLFAPKTDRLRRIDQLIQDEKSDYQLIKLELTPHTVEEIEEIKFILEKRLGKKKLEKTGIFITNVEIPIREKNFSLIDDIVNLQETSPNLRFILCSEIDFTHSSIIKNFARTTIFGNIHYYPLYDEKDTNSFVDYLLQKWNFRMEKTIKKKIFENGNGHFWLVKQAVRSLRDNPRLKLEEIFQSEAMKFRLEEIYQSFSESEQNVFRKIISRKKTGSIEESHSLNYLEKLGFIKKNKITILVLEKYIRENLPRISIEVKSHHILMNDVVVDSHFSKKEKRALRLLIEKVGIIVSRDQLAAVLWPVKTEEFYSDWAVDRLIARLREKCQQMGLNKDQIKTIRRQGYLFSH